ncbi:MAG: D-alanine--D-alanine ligase family protein, partial [Cyclobacteriaceae bacterium]
KVNGPEDYEEAIKSIFKYDTAALFESYIQGRELECAVIGNQPPIASVAGEIIISDAYDFYTYEAKYEDENAVEIKIPAQIDDAALMEIKKWSVAAYEALNCEDFARVDLFLDPQGQIFINEINTIPGFTDSSMFPSLWEASGISYTDLITRLIEMALERHKISAQLSRNYREA